MFISPDIALAALILAGASIGFLILNWHPAKIFLGEGGSLLLGFLLGVLSIISGGKIAIALLVMGLPIMDVAWTIIRRLIGKDPFDSDGDALIRLLNIRLSEENGSDILCFLSLFRHFGVVFAEQGKVVCLGLIARDNARIGHKFQLYG